MIDANIFVVSVQQYELDQVTIKKTENKPMMTIPEIAELRDQFIEHGMSFKEAQDKAIYIATYSTFPLPDICWDPPSDMPDFVQCPKPMKL